MKKVDRRNFLKLVGAGVGTAALATTPIGLLGGGWSSGTGAAALSFAAEGPVPAGAPSRFAALVLRGHLTDGDRVHGMLNQRVVAGYPATPKAQAFDRLGFSGRIERVENGSRVDFWGAVEDAADRPLLADQPFHVTIDPGLRQVTYRLQGKSHNLQLKEFSRL
ncbi:MAG: twin-arginine translocation signal domain-containing protein [Thermoplasmata archaeon]